MKRLLIILALLTGSLFGSCQCSEKPDIPPVEGGGRSAVTDAGLSAAGALPLRES